MESTASSQKGVNGIQCRLCNDEALLFHRDKKRAYYQCSSCQLVFVPETFFLSPEEEKAVYDLHDNVDGDIGYQKFLSRAAEPVLSSLACESGQSANVMPRKGLDFGCGPSPVLAKMLEAADSRISVDAYDLFYFPQNARCLERHNYYDFVTATEVVEHLADPLSAFRRLWSCLKDDSGMLVIMTKRVEGSIERFRNWHYIRDPTHISFFHTTTFEWLAGVLTTASQKCELDVVGADVVVLYKRKQD